MPGSPLAGVSAITNQEQRIRAVGGETVFDNVRQEGQSREYDILYRLSGDMNPLHADPDFAKMGSFDVPILHGLCSFGLAGRAELSAFCGNDPARMKTFEVRFAGVVFPGEGIRVLAWDEGERVLLRAEVTGSTEGRNGAPVLADGVLVRA